MIIKSRNKCGVSITGRDIICNDAKLRRAPPLPPPPFPLAAASRRPRDNAANDAVNLFLIEPPVIYRAIHRLQMSADRQVDDISRCVVGASPTTHTDDEPLFAVCRARGSIDSGRGGIPCQTQNSVLSLLSNRDREQPSTSIWIARELNAVRRLTKIHRGTIRDAGK